MALSAGTAGAAGGAEKSDLSSPKASAKTFATALTEGDASGARKAAIVTEVQGKAIDALAAMVGGFKKLSIAAETKFGAAGKDVSQGTDMINQLKNIDTAEEKIDGDSAILIVKDQENNPRAQPLKLKKVGADWKIDVDAMPDHDKMEQMTPVLKAMGKAAEDTAAEISTDKYKNADEAKQALGMKMMAVVMTNMPKEIPSTKESPTTMPDTAPEPKDDKDMK
jgi:hypothetical protein